MEGYCKAALSVPVGSWWLHGHAEGERQSHSPARWVPGGDDSACPCLMLLQKIPSLRG